MKNPIIKFILSSLTVTGSLFAEEILKPDLSKEESTMTGATFNVPAPKFNGLLQVWGIYDNTNEAQANFRVRRAEIKVSGETIPELKYFLMIDPSKSLKDGAINKDNDNKILQDAGISYQIVKGLDITVGQFKAPTTAEGLLSSGDLLLPERSIVSRSFGDRREIGAMLTFKKFDRLKLNLMGSNGGKTNTNDSNTRKDAHGRLELKLLDQVSLGTFASYSDSQVKNSYRNGVNFYTNLNGFFLNGEGVSGKIDKERTEGFYVDLGYDSKKIFKPLLRYEYFKMGTVTSNLYSAGFTYSLLAAKAKVQLSYTYLDNATTEIGTPKVKDNENGNLVLANFQVAI